MAKWCRVDEHGVVLEVLNSDPAGLFHKDLQWQSCPDTVEPGWTFLNGEFYLPQKEAGEDEHALGRATILSRLEKIDADSIRPLRAIAGGTAVEADLSKLAELNAQAQELRDELAGIN